MNYQTIGGQRGASDSEEKLRRIRFNTLGLAGKSFLDIGCNAGFFCKAAREAGATQVFGIDAVPQNIELAKANDPEGTYICADWFDALRSMNEKFDVIIHLSAFHYVTDHPEFLRLVKERLTPKGVFILECGVVRSNSLQDSPQYINVKRKGYTRHVTKPLLDGLLSDFAVRFFGRSVDQRGDPIPRFIFACTKLAQTVFLIGGDSFMGKSVVSSLLAKNPDVAHVKTDRIIASLVACPDSAVEAVISNHFADGLGRSKVLQPVFAAGIARQFCKAICDLLPRHPKVVLLEGEILSDERIRQIITNILVERGIQCWEAQRSFGFENVETPNAGTALLPLPSGIKFLSRVNDPRRLRIRPANQLILVGPLRRHHKMPSAFGWVFPPETSGMFQSFLRVDELAEPVEFIFDIVELDEITDVAAFRTKAKTTVSKVVPGGSAYVNFEMSLPASSKPTMLRITVMMAGADSPTKFARTYVVNPRIVTESGGNGLSNGQPQNKASPSEPPPIS